MLASSFRYSSVLPALCATLLIGGCTSTWSDDAPHESESPTTTTPVTTNAPSATDLVPSRPAPGDTEPTPEPDVVSDTVAVATNAVAAFCRPTLDYESWINELYPVLSQQAAIAYETVDPANVPCTSVTGEARVRDGDGAFTMRVLVPTDAGEYSVYVHRPAESAPWAVDQIVPLASE